MSKLDTCTLGMAMGAFFIYTGAMAQVQGRPPIDPLANVVLETLPPPVALERTGAEKGYPTGPQEVEMPFVPRSTGLGLGLAGVFSAAKVAPEAVSPATTTLAPPVELTYSGTSPVLSIHDGGTSKGVQALITTVSNSSSALYGQTNGSGAGVTGYNAGTTGYAGKFGITNTASNQPAIGASTTGLGPVLVASTTNNANSAAVIQAKATAGIAVSGTSANYIGVLGISPPGYGLVGESTSGTGVYASSGSGRGASVSSLSSDALYASSYGGSGVRAISTNSYAVSGSTSNGIAALYAENAGGGRGIVSHSVSGIGVYSTSNTNVGVWGETTNSYGVVGVDRGSGYGVWGQSATGYAGYFNGKVAATSYATLSDRNAKTNFAPIDGKDVLERVSHLPITSWDFKTDLKTRHLGPMAQDFHAAFGLNGADDTHINLTDVAGVSLAAIQELAVQVKALRAKDAEIAELRAQLKSVTDTFAARLTALEHSSKAATEQAVMRPAKRSAPASWQ